MLFMVEFAAAPLRRYCFACDHAYSNLDRTSTAQNLLAERSTRSGELCKKRNARLWARLIHFTRTAYFFAARYPCRNRSTLRT